MLRHVSAQRRSRDGPGAASLSVGGSAALCRSSDALGGRSPPSAGAARLARGGGDQVFGGESACEGIAGGGQGEVRAMKRCAHECPRASSLPSLPPPSSPLRAQTGVAAADLRGVCEQGVQQQYGGQCGGQCGVGEGAGLTASASASASFQIGFWRRPSPSPRLRG